MKGLFLIFHGLEEHNGISKKISYQMKAFEECGVEMRLCYLTDSNNRKVRWIDKEPVSDYGGGKKAKLLKRTDFGGIITYVKREKIDFIYARHDHNANPFTINLYRTLRRCNCKLLLEIPTYPYDLEYKGFPLAERINLTVDKMFRRRMAGHVDYIVTFSSEKEIWGKETIGISNGIDFSRIPLKKTVNDTSASLNLIGVAEIHYWHGFDRVIRGIGEYRRKNGEHKVFFHIVGNTGEGHGAEFREIIKEYGIEDRIIFHGALHGEPLTRRFEEADMGVGSLGRHRCGITNIKTLKNREYAARGIPFIYSETDGDFDNRPYVLKEPHNDEPVDMEEVVGFYKSNSWAPAEIRKSVEGLSWKIQMRKILDKVFRDEKEN